MLWFYCLILLLYFRANSSSFIPSDLIPIALIRHPGSIPHIPIILFWFPAFPVISLHVRVIPTQLPSTYLLNSNLSDSIKRPLSNWKPSKNEQLTSAVSRLFQMLDPLSIIASVGGLFATTAKIASIAKQLYDSGKDAPSSIRRIGEEMDQLHLIFGQVQMLLEGHAEKRPSRSRLSMLPLHHLMTILSGCVLAYSSLDKRLSEVASTGLRSRVRWALWKEAEAGLILVELERHKSSLHMMLTIIQW